MLMKHQAEHDPMTELLNRGSFDRILKLYEKDENAFALILIDVDNFKSVNDTYGHAAGDIILKKVANLLTNAFRTVDYICRIGGDEFAVIMVQMTSDLSYTITQKIAEINRLLANPEDGTPAVSLSVGVAFTDRQNPGNSLFKDADIALYYTKEHGRNGCYFYPII
ncbi:MAG: GGDEF domain-containing protein, partial [Blautia sp.]